MGTGKDREESRYKKMKISSQIWVTYNTTVAHSLQEIGKLIH